MLNHIKTYLQFGNQFCGIEHTSLNGDNMFQSVVLKKTKKEAEIESQFNAKSIEELVKQLLKNQHAFLVINDINILTKRVDAIQNDALKIVRLAFPNIILDDFYYEILSQDDSHFVSIGRKEHINQLIDNFTKNKIYIIGVSLGNSLFSSVSKYISESDFATSNSLITVDNYTIVSIEKSINADSRMYNVNGLSIGNIKLLSLSGALSYLLKNYFSKTNLTSKQQSLANDFKQFRLFSQSFKFGLILTLGFLLTNFLVFNNYFNKVNALQQTAQINKATKENFLTLNESVSKVEKMVNDMENSNASKSSFYASVILQALPSSIVLDELNYQPLIKGIKLDKPIQIDEKIVLISGISSDSEVFSKWLTALEAIEWIGDVDILNYAFKSNNSNEFSLKIVTIDDL